MIAAPLVSSEAIEEISLAVLRRSRELALGERTSALIGHGVDFAGLRNFEPGDRPEMVDWAHSTHTGFNPLVVREWVQDSHMPVFFLADASPSVMCGLDGLAPAHLMAYTLATIGFSASIFQDPCGIAVHREYDCLAVESLRSGRRYVYNLISAYEDSVLRRNSVVTRFKKYSDVIQSNLKRPSLVVAVSDGLFKNPDAYFRDLAEVLYMHDVIFVLADPYFVFADVIRQGGWLKCFDSESGQVKIIGSADMRRAADSAKNHSAKVLRSAEKHGISSLRLPPNLQQAQDMLSDFFLVRRQMPKLA